jgi:hypothetical protein
MAELTTTWSADDEDLGALDVEVHSAGFTGRSHAWFSRAKLKSTFVAALNAYPFDPAAPPFLDGLGLTPNEATRDVRISVTPYNFRGTLLVRVDLARRGLHSRDGVMEQTLVVRFLTEYGLVARFAKDLEALLDGSKEIATLHSQEP